MNTDHNRASGSLKKQDVDPERLAFKQEYEATLERETNEALTEKLNKVVEAICIVDSYIGCVAQGEVHFWQARRDHDSGNEGSVVEVMLGESPGIN